MMSDTATDALHWRVVGLCWLVLALEGYDISAIGYSIPSLVDAWHLRPPAFTAALTAGSLGMLVGALTGGPLGDWIGRKPVLLGSVAAFGLFSLLSASVTGPDLLAVYRFLTGVGLGAGIPLAIALASDHAPPGSQGKLVILMSSGVSVGNTLGGFLAAWMVPHFGWPAIFIVGGLLPVVVLPVLWARLPESALLAAIERHRNPVSALFAPRLALATCLLWAMNLLNLLGNYFILFWMPAILHSQGFTPSRAILGGSMYALGSILGALITAPIVDRLGAERVLSAVLVIGALAVLSIGLLPLPFAALAGVICLTGIGIGGCQHGINSLSGRIYPPSIRSTGAGWALGSGRIGNIAGPLVGGILLSLGWLPTDIFLAAAGPAFCVALCMVMLGRTTQRAALRQMPAV